MIPEGELQRQHETAEAFLARLADGTGPEDLDGVMTPATQLLVARFSATGVDMTSWWAWTAPDWTCPACGRSKSDLVRLNQNGHLICRLVEHHDHMQNLLLRRFQAISVAQHSVVADELAERFAKRASLFVSAYDNAIVCNDCNNADVPAKRAAAAHPEFSFSPQELRQIVIARPNAPHEIRAVIAAQLWAAQAETFALRLRIVERIAQIAATDAHWFQAGEHDSLPDRIEARARSAASLYGAPTWALGRLCGEPRTSIPSDLTRWRRIVRKPRTRAPSPSEVEHAARVVAPKLWSAVGEDWRCPCCGRTRLEAVRPSASNAWTFTPAVKRLRVASEGAPQQLTLCSDCGDAAVNLRREAQHGADSASRVDSLSIADIAAVVRPQPNARHNYDNEAADMLVARLRAEAGQVPAKR